ncbi:syncoilin [Lissotriton helveticus]
MSEPEQEDEGPEGEESEGEAAGKQRDQMMCDVGVYCQLMEDNDNGGLEDLGDRFELCIQTVEELELKRDDLIREITLLLEPKLEDIREAHEDIAKAYRLQAQVVLERDSLSQEIRAVKRKLFQVTRECVACQYQLGNRRHDVAQFQVSKEELQSMVTQLSEELSSVRDTCAQRKQALLQRLEVPQSRRGSRYLQDSRRLSMEFENFMLESRHVLEAEYEPVFVRLLERGAASASALQQTQEEVNRLKEALRPLQAEVSELHTRNWRLEQRIVLKKRRRDEEVLQLREQVDGLESRIREMKIGVQLQQRRNTELEQLRSGLTHELSIYKGCLEIYGQLCTKEAKTE